MIHQYSAKPSFTTRGKSSSNLFLGIELEVEPKRDNNGEIISKEIIDCLGNFVITKYDSSVPNGFEICSSPASLEYHLTAWDKFFEKITSKLKGFRTKTCGMHVHISRAPLSHLQIGKILIFIYNPENYRFIRRIAQRESSYHNDFQQKRLLGDAKPEKCMGYDKHTAINLRYDHTVEIRLFKSNLKKEMFLKNIEFCHALAKFTWAGVTPLSNCKSWKNYANFIKENKNTYPNLYKFLVEYSYLFDKRLKKQIQKEREKERELEEIKIKRSKHLLSKIKFEEQEKKKADKSFPPDFDSWYETMEEGHLRREKEFLKVFAAKQKVLKEDLIEKL